MHQITKYEFIFMLWISVQTGITAQFLSTTCTGQQQGDMDFRTINVTKKSGKKCKFDLRTLNLVEMSRDVILFDTPRLNCKGGEAVKFPYSFPKQNYRTKNYCNNDAGECMVYRRKLKEYPRQDVLDVVSDEFPNCTSYVIRPKLGKDITVTLSTTALTLRYKLFSMPISTTASSQGFASTNSIDSTLATVPYSISHTGIETATNGRHIEKGADTTTSVPDLEKEATSSALTSPLSVSQTKNGQVTNTNAKPREQGKDTREVSDQKTDTTKATQTEDKSSSTVPQDATVTNLEPTSNQQPAANENMMSKLTGGKVAAIVVPPALGSLAILASLIMRRRRNGIVHHHVKIMQIYRKEETKEQPEQQITFM